MDTDHPNIQLMKRLDLGDLASAKDLFAENVVWRFVDGRIAEVWDIVPGQPTEGNDAGH
jgi:ketosteroid isomerase-like protein